MVAVIQSLYCKDNMLAHLLRCLFLWAALGSFWFVAKHIPGKENCLADAISRNQHVKYSHLIPRCWMKHQ